MTWERLLLRAVPVALASAALVVQLFTSSLFSLTLSLGAAALSALMASAVVFYETGVRRSERALRRWTAPDHALASERRAGALWTSSYGLANFDNVTVRELSMQGIDMTDASFSGALLERCDLSEALLARADFSSAVLAGSDFTEAVLRSAKLASADVDSCDFTKAALDGSDWTQAVLANSAFQGSCLERVRLREARIDACDFDGAIAAHSDLSDAVLQGCRFGLSSWERSDFSRASFEECEIGKLDLSSLVLERTTIDPDTEPHKPLLVRLLSAIAEQTAERWIVIDSPASAYVQVVFEIETQRFRCEAVNFDSWPGLKRSRKMTPDMSRRLRELGFGLEANENFVWHPPDGLDRREIASRLALVLYDVYGVSEDAPLAVTLGVWLPVEEGPSSDPSE